MYTRHFNLRDRPFRLTPDLALRYPEASQEAALETLLVALEQGEGFIKVVGEVGLGKTLLCRLLLERLGPDHVTAWLPDPQLSPGTMRQALARDLGVELPARASRQEVHHRLQAALMAMAAEGKRPVVIIDEAQALPDTTLEAVRLLTNLETERRKLLQVVLFGQPELDRRLARRDFRQLRQRITYSCTLDPLGRDQVRDYVHHRLTAAGGSPDLFTPAAIRSIARHSGGVPRLINVLCDKSLLAAWGRGHAQAGWMEVQRAVRDTDGAREQAWSWRFRPALGAATLGLAVIGAWWFMELIRGAGT